MPGCASKTQAPTFPIGQRVQVGKLFYQVVEAQWKAELNGYKQTPKDRILQIHFTVTNSGAEEVSIPTLRLIDANGNEKSEIVDIEGNEKWMGTIRRLQPALTEEGLVFFDVPIGAYKLEVVDNSVAENEKVALIEIPASLAPPPPPPGGAKGL
ncbi:MAG: DUF4352 domain-containing protein [Acidobacteria bacterium]|nr:DUF4352 domain-containing protein [Acidobacteriota bacterium]